MAPTRLGLSRCRGRHLAKGRRVTRVGSGVFQTRVTCGPEAEEGRKDCPTRGQRNAPIRSSSRGSLVSTGRARRLPSLASPSVNVVYSPVPFLYNYSLFILVMSCWIRSHEVIVVIIVMCLLLGLIAGTWEGHNSQTNGRKFRS